MAYKQLPDIELLNKRLDYDAETGVLTWKPRAAADFQAVESRRAETLARNFNTSHAGKRAGSQNHHKGYWYVMIDQIFYAVHRVAWKMGTGEEPQGDMDHINGDPEDNSLANLRVVSKAENNRFGRSRRRTKVYGAGVFFNRGTWVATAVGQDGKAIPLGRHRTKAEAVAARRKFRNASSRA